jgi:hypothetical protein
MENQHLVRENTELKDKVYDCLRDEFVGLLERVEDLETGQIDSDMTVKELFSLVNSDADAFISEVNEEDFDT